MTNSKSKTGFAFGVFLGAVVGTAALHLSHSKSSKDDKKKNITQKIQTGIETLKEQYPQQVKQVEDIVHQALKEAQQATSEITQLTNLSSSKATPTGLNTATTSFTKQAQKFQRRFFSKSGKTLDPTS